ncbi:MAG: hypothetical protein KKD86_19160 [Bacteroidetes bacterium]|nr:hypothetical protein [Bacteroidota bacterium]
MKTIFLFIMTIFLSSHLFCQEKENINYQESPYKISGEGNLDLPIGYIKNDMKMVGFL